MPKVIKTERTITIDSDLEYKPGADMSLVFTTTRPLAIGHTFVVDRPGWLLELIETVTRTLAPVRVEPGLRLDGRAYFAGEALRMTPLHPLRIGLRNVSRLPLSGVFSLELDEYDIP